LRQRDEWTWRITMSDAIHPNMAGHKQIAEELCHSITGQRISLDDIGPPSPALVKIATLLQAGKPVRVLAMPPYDTLIDPALRLLYDKAQVEVTPWPVTGKSLMELEQAAKATARTMKPDLV